LNKNSKTKETAFDAVKTAYTVVASVYFLSKKQKKQF
jgi:hypothetical protein